MVSSHSGPLLRNGSVCCLFWKVAWVSAAAGVAYWTQFFQVILQLHDQNNKPEHHHQVNRPMLQLAAVGFGILVVLTLYLTIYLPKVVGVKDSAAWDVYCPRVIPTMIIVAIITSLALVRATWPVWGFFAPLILALEAMGALFALHFIPSCAWGTTTRRRRMFNKSRANKKKRANKKVSVNHEGRINLLDATYGVKKLAGRHELVN